MSLRRVSVGWKPSGAKPRPIPAPSRADSGAMLGQLRLVSCSVSTGAPDSSNWPPGSSEIEAPRRLPRPFRPIGTPSSRIGSHSAPASPSSMARMPPGRRRRGPGACGPTGGSRTSRAPCRSAMPPSACRRPPDRSASCPTEAIGVSSASIRVGHGRAVSSLRGPRDGTRQRRTGVKGAPAWVDRRGTGAVPAVQGMTRAYTDIAADRLGGAAAGAVCGPMRCCCGWTGRSAPGCCSCPGCGGMLLPGAPAPDAPGWWRCSRSAAW